MDAAIASFAIAAGSLVLFVAALARAGNRFEGQRARLDKLHDTDAIHTDEIFSKDTRQSVCVVDIDMKGIMRNRGVESSFINMPPIEARSTRLTLIDLQAQSGGLGRRNSAAEEGNHIHHFERFLTKPFLSRTQSSVFDAWDLLRLWTPKSGGVGADFQAWRISTSILGSFIAPRDLNEDAALSRNRAFFFRPHCIEVWDCISTVQTRALTAGGTEVVCYFGTLPFKFVGEEITSNSGLGIETGRPSSRAQHVRQFSPLKDHFRRIIHSENSACSLERPDANLSIMLVVIDLLRAAIECWMVHVTLLSRRVRSMPADDTHQEPAANFDSVQSIRTATRDLQSAIDFVFDTACERLEATRHHGSVTALNSMRIETNAKLKTMTFAVDDLVEWFSSYAEKTTAQGHRDQASSVKRLTLLASVSLPISLASGLLSMSTRAADLGFIWFDLLGVSLLLITVAVLCHRIMRVSHLILAKWEASVASGYQASRKQRQVTTMELHALPGLGSPDVWVNMWKFSFSGLIFALGKVLIPIPFILFFCEGMFGSLDGSLEALPLNMAGVGFGLSMIASAYGTWSVLQSNWWRGRMSRLRRTK